MEATNEPGPESLLKRSAVIKATLSKVDDWFEPLGCLGNGRFSCVFLAKARSSERKVAIEFFRHKTHQNKSTSNANGGNQCNEGNEASEAFQRRLRNVRGLTQRLGRKELPPIVVHECFMAGNNWSAIVTKYCDGGTLARAISKKRENEAQSKRAFSERRIAWYALQLSEALAHANERNVFHGNVNSSSVMIDWTGGGRLLLTDFGGTTPGPCDTPELRAYRVGVGESIDEAKADAFGLGCVLVELLCCGTPFRYSTDQTVADFVADKGADATLDQAGVKLPWIPDANRDSVGPQIGYSVALRTIVKSLIEPDPVLRLSASQIKKPLGTDPTSPLLSEIVPWSQIPAVGEPLTVDNIQLGLFVRRGRDWRGFQSVVADSSATEKSSSLNSLPATALRDYSNFSSEALRLRRHKNIEAQRVEEIGVVVELNSGAQTTTVVFPSSGTLEVQIGANNRFELKVGPSFNKFFAPRDRVHHTGLISTGRLTELVGKQITTSSGFTRVTDTCLLVRVDLERDLAIVVPEQRIENPPHHFQKTVLPRPEAPVVDYVEPQQATQPPPKHWSTDGNRFEEEDNARRRKAVLELFFSGNGGMDTQIHKIVSIQRMQCHDLWETHAMARVRVAAGYWGVCNERRLFSGTGLLPPTIFLGNNGRLFLTKFSNRALFGHRNCYNDLTSGLKQIILSRVALGRVDVDTTLFPLRSAKDYNSRRGYPNRTVFNVFDPCQAYPEYIITYRTTPAPTINPKASAENNQEQAAATSAVPRSLTKRCVICFERDTRLVFNPCGHVCLCEVCGTKEGLKKMKRKCPECRAAIKGVITMYARVVDD